MIERQPGRALPMLEIGMTPPHHEREPLGVGDERLVEYRPEPAVLPTFHVWTLGCQMNQADSEEMAGRLLAAGCREVGAPDEADLVVINTCAIRAHAEARVIGRQGYLRDLKERRPGMRVVLTGCSVREMDRATLPRRYPAVDLFLRPDEEPELVDRLGLASAQAAVGLTAAVGSVGSHHGHPVGLADGLAGTRRAAVEDGTIRRTRGTSAWLPIVYGCDKTCTYCIVPFSRGPERSRPIDDIVAEASAIAAAGIREITLLGQNVNSYGHDLAPEARFGHIATERWAGRRLELASRPDLAELIRTLDAMRASDGAPAFRRIRFMTSHPWDLSDRLIEAMADCPSVCEYLHLPIQSGDDAMLRRMGRQYTVAHYRERLDRIREAVPGIAIGTDVIVGFCGETEQQYEATLATLREIRYDTVYAAAYSERPGTPATRLADDVAAAEKRRRLNGLLAAQEPIALERNRSWLGRAVEVLIEDEARPRSHDHELDAGQHHVAATTPGEVRLMGRTRQSKLVHLTGPAALVGRFVEVRIEHAGPYALRGSIVH
jgi:tRNA-2-methylthio-N6-dimethylallyladenosine synthase